MDYFNNNFTLGSKKYFRKALKLELEPEEIKKDGDRKMETEIKEEKITVPIKRDGERRGKDWRIRRRERRQNREKE